MVLQAIIKYENLAKDSEIVWILYCTMFSKLSLSGIPKDVFSIRTHRSYNRYLYKAYLYTKSRL